MSKEKFKSQSLEFHALTPQRWDDFEKLFGEKGAYGGCWCMWWRTTRSQSSESKVIMRCFVDEAEMDW